MDDERRGHQALLLQAVMRVHPVGARYRSIVIGLNRAVRDRWSLRPWEAVLHPGRKLPMPMHKSARASFISEFDAEPFTGGQTNARTSVRAGKSEDLGWPTIHLEHSCSGDETLRNRRCGAHQTGQDGQDASSERGAKKVTARVELAHGLTRVKYHSRFLPASMRELSRRTGINVAG